MPLRVIVRAAIVADRRRTSALRPPRDRRSAAAATAGPEARGGEGGVRAMPGRGARSGTPRSRPSVGPSMEDPAAGGPGFRVARRPPGKNRPGRAGRFYCFFAGARTSPRRLRARPGGPRRTSDAPEAGETPSRERESVCVCGRERRVSEWTFESCPVLVELLRLRPPAITSPVTSRLTVPSRPQSHHSILCRHVPSNIPTSSRPQSHPIDLPTCYCVCVRAVRARVRARARARVCE